MWFRKHLRCHDSLDRLDVLLDREVGEMSKDERREFYALAEELLRQRRLESEK